MNKLINFPSLTPELRPAFSRVLKYLRRSTTFLAAFFNPRGLRERWTKYNVAAVPDEVVNSSMYPLEWKEKSTRENWKVPAENENWTDTYRFETAYLCQQWKETIPSAFFTGKYCRWKESSFRGSGRTERSLRHFPFLDYFSRKNMLSSLHHDKSRRAWLEFIGYVT